MTEKIILTISEIRTLYGFSRGHILKLINDKQIKAYKVGGIWRIDKDSLEAYLQTFSNM